AARCEPSGGAGIRGPSPCFICVKNAGSGDCNGVYRASGRRWLDHDVYENHHGDCIISREASSSSKSPGTTRHGFVLGRGGSPLYGVRTEQLSVPAAGWKVLQGREPAPDVLTFGTWPDCLHHGGQYFAQEAEKAAKGGHWQAVLVAAGRAFECHSLACPRGVGDSRHGGAEWSQQACEVLGARAEASLRLGDFRQALVDASAAVHFAPAFEWTKARTRGIAACLGLGVEESQARLLMEELCSPSARPGVFSPGVLAGLACTPDSLAPNGSRDSSGAPSCLSCTPRVSEEGETRQW
ncbi:unnamed protein product, partial [Prorocentrum cordatum]